MHETRKAQGRQLVALVLLLSGSSAGLAQLAPSAWPDYGGGSSNTHRSRGPGPGGNVRVEWVFPVPHNEPGHWNFSHRQAAISADGTIVLCTYGEDESCVTALNPDGTQRWEFRVGGLCCWPCADVQGNVYFTSWSGFSRTWLYLYSVRETDGSKVWSYWDEAYAISQSGPTVGPNGVVYASNDNGVLYAYSPDPPVDWSRDASGFMDNPAVAPDGTVITSASDVQAHDPSGKLLWRYPHPSGVGKFAPASIADDGTIYAGSGCGSAMDVVVALDPCGGELWTYSGAGGATAIGPEGTIYAGYKGMLHAINPDGQQKWTFLTGQTSETGAEGVTVDSRGNVYAANKEGLLMSINPLGELRWSLDLAPDYGGNIWPSAPIIGDDATLYIGGGYTAKVFAVIPEPATLALLAVGGLALTRRRRRSLAGETSGAAHGHIEPGGQKHSPRG